MLPKEAQALAMPPEKRLRPNEKESLPPCPNGPCQKHQAESIRFRVCWSFDLSPKDHELLAQESILGNQFGFSRARSVIVPSNSEVGSGCVPLRKRRGRS